MSRRHVEVGDLKRGDFFWLHGVEFQIEHDSGSYIHAANSNQHVYLEWEQPVEVDPIQ